MLIIGYLLWFAAAEKGIQKKKCLTNSLCNSIKHTSFYNVKFTLMVYKNRCPLFN